jgi:hypothetical protein
LDGWEIKWELLSVVHPKMKYGCGWNTQATSESTKLAQGYIIHP